MKKFSMLLAVLTLMGTTSWATAQEEDARTLRERIKSVSNRLFDKSGRVELSLFPMTSLSLNDAFYQKFGGGLSAAYFFTESMGAQVMLTYSLNVETSNAAYFGRKEEYVPYAGKRSILANADFIWAPLYGKINLASEFVMHFDTYLMIGLGVLGSEQVEGSNFGFAGDVGLGLRFFFSRMFALKLEIKDYMVFNDAVSFRSQEVADVQHQLYFNLGLSMFFLGDDEEG
ncbi:MAG: outer membrane beta-barrel domain-containing protein [Deltaproteobacteria bacterium]|nr:outer membrane beta-barrel domain-containing protein [Deltaproteobacteria bacterium]